MEKSKFEIYFGNGKLYYKEKNFEKAAENFRLAAEAWAESCGTEILAEVYAKCGLSLKKSGRREEALEYFRRSTDINSTKAEVYYNWGLALQKLGRYEESVEKYRKATEINPRYAIAYSNWGLTLGHLGRYAEEIERCRRAVEIDPGYAKAYGNWGFALWKLDRKKEAGEKLAIARNLFKDQDNPRCLEVEEFLKMIQQNKNIDKNVYFE